MGAPVQPNHQHVNLSGCAALLSQRVQGLKYSGKKWRGFRRRYPSYRAPSIEPRGSTYLTTMDNGPRSHNRYDFEANNKAFGSVCGCFCKLGGGPILVGVLITGAVLFGVYVRAPDLETPKCYLLWCLDYVNETYFWAI